MVIHGLMVPTDGRDTVPGIMDIMDGDIPITEDIMVDTTVDIMIITMVVGDILIIIPIIGEVILLFPEIRITVSRLVEKPYQGVHAILHL